MVPRENKTMLMQNLGGQTKSIMVFSQVAYYIEPNDCLVKPSAWFTNATPTRMQRRGNTREIYRIPNAFASAYSRKGNFFILCFLQLRLRVNWDNANPNEA